MLQGEEGAPPDGCQPSDQAGGGCLRALCGFGVVRFVHRLGLVRGGCGQVHGPCAPLAVEHQRERPPARIELCEGFCDSMWPFMLVGVPTVIMSRASSGMPSLARMPGGGGTANSVSLAPLGSRCSCVSPCSRAKLMSR